MYLFILYCCFRLSNCKSLSFSHIAFHSSFYSFFFLFMPVLPLLPSPLPLLLFSFFFFLFLNTSSRSRSIFLRLPCITTLYIALPSSPPPPLFLLPLSFPCPSFPLSHPLSLSSPPFFFSSFFLYFSLSSSSLPS